jgi:hypothetical protein
MKLGGIGDLVSAELKALSPPPTTTTLQLRTSSNLRFALRKFFDSDYLNMVINYSNNIIVMISRSLFPKFLIE